VTGTLCAIRGVLLCALLIAPGARAGEEHTPDKILIVGGRSLGGLDHVARVLDEMVAVSGVVGETRFETLPDVEATDPDLLPLLTGRDDVRAVIALVGNLSLLDGINPSRRLPERQDVLSNRRLPSAELREVLDRLDVAASASGTRVTFARAPIGPLGRIEVPELIKAGEALQQAFGSSVLDLQTPFAAADSMGAFSNTIDVLSIPGHEEVARLLFATLLREDGPVPARDARERRARMTQRAFDTWMAGDNEGFLALAAELLSEPPADDDDALRQAALVTARDGMSPETRRLWQSLPRPGSAEAVQGLGMALALCKLDPGPVHSDDPLEQAMIEVARELFAHRIRKAWELGNDLVERHPERVEAWVALQLLTATTTTLPLSDLRDRAHRSLSALRDDPVHPERWRELLRGSANVPADYLPVMLIGARPYRALQPVGPLLDQARRRAAIGYVEAAINPLRKATRQMDLPLAWEQELVDLESRLAARESKPTGQSPPR